MLQEHFRVHYPILIVVSFGFGYISILSPEFQYVNNRAGLPHQPTRVRERGMRCFRSTRQAQRFFWCTRSRVQSVQSWSSLGISQELSDTTNAGLCVVEMCCGVIARQGVEYMQRHVAYFVHTFILYPASSGVVSP